MHTLQDIIQNLLPDENLNDILSAAVKIPTKDVHELIFQNETANTQTNTYSSDVYSDFTCDHQISISSSIEMGVETAADYINQFQYSLMSNLDMSCSDYMQIANFHRTDSKEKCSLESNIVFDSPIPSNNKRKRSKETENSFGKSKYQKITDQQNVHLTLSQENNARETQPVVSQQARNLTLLTPRRRAVYTSEQRNVLENVFNRSKYITKKQQKDLGMKLGLSAQSVYVWFSNRRNRRTRLNPDQTFTSTERTILSERAYVLYKGQYVPLSGVSSLQENC